MLARIVKQTLRLQNKLPYVRFSRNFNKGSSNQDLDLDDEFADENNYSSKVNSDSTIDHHDRRSGSRGASYSNTERGMDNSRNYQDRNRSGINQRSEGFKNRFNDNQNMNSEYESSRGSDRNPDSSSRADTRGYGADDQQNYQRSRGMTRGGDGYNRDHRNNYPQRGGGRDMRSYEDNERGGNRGMDYSDEPNERDYSRNYQRSEAPYRHQERNNSNTYYNQDQPKQQRWREDGYRPNKEYNPADPARNTRNTYQRGENNKEHWNSPSDQHNARTSDNRRQDLTRETEDEPYVQAVYYRREVRFQTFDDDEVSGQKAQNDAKKNKNSSKRHEDGNEFVKPDDGLEKNTTNFIHSESEKPSTGGDQAKTSQSYHSGNQSHSDKISQSTHSSQDKPNTNQDASTGTSTHS